MRRDCRYDATAAAQCREKTADLSAAFSGLGLETAFPVLYTELVLKNIISLEKLMRMMSENPRRRFGIKTDVGFSVWLTNISEKINSKSFQSRGRSTPFEGMTVKCRNLLTVYNRKTFMNPDFNVSKKTIKERE